MKVTIDGKQIEAEEKKTLLEVARENNIYIPSLCDHKHLSPFAGCRLCITQIKGQRDYLPSCSTYVEDGMEVKTKTPALKRLRKQILELILSEHPNACLICSEKENCDEMKSTIRKVGETTGCVLCPNNSRCELQDVVEAVGIDKVRFPSFYRDFELKKSDPFFDRNYNLCILCGRCVRVCHELRGASTVSFVYRGSQAVIGTVLDRTLLESGCQFCGACVDVCPTGALTERTIKYEKLPEKKASTICPLCSMGCELEVELQNGRILSSRPSADGAVNRGQACVKGRFIIRDLVHSSRRILKPMIRRKKELEEVTWEEALDFVSQRLKKYKGEDIALVTSAQISCEDNFLIQKFAREILKTENIVNPSVFSPLATYMEMAQVNDLKSDLNFRIDDIPKAKLLFLVGSDLPVSHPIIWLEVLKAVRAGARLVVASPTEFFLNRYASIWLQIKPGTEFYLISLLSRFLLGDEYGRGISKIRGFRSFKNFLDGVNLSRAFEITGVREDQIRETAELILETETSAFLFGPELTQNSRGVESMTALWNLACMSDARLIPLGLENNLRGVFGTNQGSSGKGLALNQITKTASSGEIKALFLAGPFPDLKKHKLEFLVVQDCYLNGHAKKADAVFPATTFAETGGTFVNAEGRIQKFRKVIDSIGEARPDWWIISRLAQKMGNSAFNYKSLAEIQKEMHKNVSSFSKISFERLENDDEVFVQEDRKGEKKFVPLTENQNAEKTSKKYPFLMCVEYDLDYYRNLSLSQDIRGLRMIRDSRWFKISPEDAKKLGLKERESIVVESSSGKINGLVKVSESVPKGMIRANFLWSEEPDFSMANLVFPPSRRNLFLNLFPAKIKRGKR